MAIFALLEDDQTLATLLIASLENAGHKVAHYLTASEAIEASEDQDVDIVVADVFIKVGNQISEDGGIKLIAQMKQVLGRNIPIIAISGSFNGTAASSIASTVVTVGANATLAKPFHPQELIDLSKELMEQPKFRSR